MMMMLIEPTCICLFGTENLKKKKTSQCYVDVSKANLTFKLANSEKTNLSKSWN